MSISKVCTQIAPKLSMLRQWKSVNEASMSLPNGVSKTCTNTVLNMVNKFHINKPWFILTPLYKIFITW